MNWQVQQAKARFSELVERAASGGPQTVTKHGRPVAVVLGVDEYRRLRALAPDFNAFLKMAPLEGIDLERRREYGRNVKL